VNAVVGGRTAGFSGGFSGRQPWSSLTHPSYGGGATPLAPWGHDEPRRTGDQRPRGGVCGGEAGAINYGPP
jgi:hypothetical protein